MTLCKHCQCDTKTFLDYIIRTVDKKVYMEVGKCAKCTEIKRTFVTEGKVVNDANVEVLFLKKLAGK